MFSPPRMMTSLIRPTIVSQPLVVDGADVAGAEPSVVGERVDVAIGVSCSPQNSSGPRTSNSPVPSSMRSSTSPVGRPSVDAALERIVAGVVSVVIVGASVEPYVRLTVQPSVGARFLDEGGGHAGAAGRHQPQRRDRGARERRRAHQCR